MASLRLFNPLKYTNFNQYQIQAIKKILNQYGHCIQLNKSKVLEVGCGEGYVTKNIIYPFLKGEEYRLGRDSEFSGVSEFIAIDQSKHMIEWAQKYNNHEHIDYQVMDITEEPPKEFFGKFDFIVSSMCFMYLTRQQK